MGNSRFRWARLEGWQLGRSSPVAILRDGRATRAASSEREKESNLGWRGRMTFRDSLPGGNFDSQRPHSGVEYSSFWGLATPSGDSFSRSEEAALLGGRLEGWPRATEIGRSRFRRSFVRKSGRPDFGAVHP